MVSSNQQQQQEGSNVLPFPSAVEVAEAASSNNPLNGIASLFGVVKSTKQPSARRASARSSASLSPVAPRKKEVDVDNLSGPTLPAPKSPRAKKAMADGASEAPASPKPRAPKKPKAVPPPMDSAAAAP